MVRHQKEKLQLKLEVLHLHHMTTASQDESEQSAKSRASSGSLSKKRTLGWPQDFVPGMSVTSDFNALDLPAFVSGYLAMIKLFQKHIIWTRPFSCACRAHRLPDFFQYR